MKAHQRKIRERIAKEEPRETLSLDGCYVKEITKSEAEIIILRYEWLGTMPKILRAAYGMFSPDGELVGAACFGMGSGTKAATHLCGEQYRNLAICLERGACAHFVHEHAPSWFVKRACEQAAEDYGWRIFYAYSDIEAGEIGTIYQALNWVYLGAGAGRGQHLTLGKSWRYRYIKPTGEKVTSRVVRGMKNRGEIPRLWHELEELGWSRTKEFDKGKYVQFYGGNRRERKMLRRALKPQPQPYPKRKAA